MNLFSTANRREPHHYEDDPSWVSSRWATAVHYLLFFSIVGSQFVNLYWPFGFLFMWWCVSSMMTGESLFVLPIHRSEQPVFFYLVSFVWFMYGVWMVVYDLFPIFTARYLTF